MYANSTTNKTSIPCSSLKILEPFFIFSIMLSIVCIIITIIVLSYLSKFKTLHGKILLSFSGCLGTMYFLLFLSIYLNTFMSMPLCVTIGTLTYIMFIATFFWLNVMAYYMWNTITTMVPKESFVERKYLKYSIYAWTSTIITSLPMIIVQNTIPASNPYHPGIGYNSCWITHAKAPLLYMNTPVGIILFANLVMFILTIKTIIKCNDSSEALQVHQDKKRFILYLKLFLVMGLIWLTDFLPVIIQNCHLLLLMDILNSLHGFFLFLIFIYKKKIFIAISMFFKKNKCLTKSNESSSS